MPPMPDYSALAVARSTAAIRMTGEIAAFAEVGGMG
jgi:hypothetical protein